MFTVPGDTGETDLAKRSKRNERARYLHSNARLLAAPLYVPRLSPVTSHILQLEDRRLWTPIPFTQPARASIRSAARLEARPSRFSNPFALTSRVAFAVPGKVAVCVRRHRRRETLFANKVAGGSVGRHRRRRRSSFSNVGC